MEIGLNLLQIQPFSSAHMFRTLRPCYICDKLSPNLRHPAPLTAGYLGVFIYSKQPYFTSFPEERCSCQISTADLPWESSKQAVGRLLITYNLFSRFCLFFFSPADRWSMSKLLCIYYCLLFIYAKLFNEYFTWANFSLGVCNELSFD